ncbi:glutamine--fructose-6-phosphate transaminase (isomerizing) [Halobacterium jilantaiense]|uniref:Glutamine--fructose-6-phosphate aminotransferase [isomerizing] n=1 Tax=Halobacterium jilantaiense TaxID=355548 RepID=A0A1I0MU34_9EURY|nr:glutamine--fructose-6-phosphate transaminase (isomerizing) [Halobacterium jilantaiense]SEV91866.1 glutamine--fructose-6-phosphate transaminase [Halobacterium jilantaiense]
MCGIVGYAGDNEALPVVASGLKNLEYRGYDSAGVALLDGDIDVFKSSGEIDDLTLPDNHDASVGVGHTRWSTHGKPTDANAHPHTACSGDIAVVHNGIIDNYEALKAALVEDGHEFLSETDTEVVPHLLEERYDDENLIAAVEDVVNQLDGSFALAVTAVGYDGIVVARKDSPLVVGVSPTRNFVASDVTAFLEHTQDVVFLEDGDVAAVTRDSVDVRNGGEQVTRETRTVDWEADSAGKAGYDHYMLKEIHEQPQALRQTISGRLDVARGTVDLDLDLPENYLKSLEEIQIVACGTSYHAGLYARRLLEEYADVRCSVEVASEYEFTGGRDPWRTLVVAVTQSGETADTLRAMRKADAAGARTLAVTNTVGSTAAREANDVVYIRAGPEIGVAATKTFAAQVTTLSMLTVAIGLERGALAGDRASTLLHNVRGLPGAVQQALDDADRVRETASELADSEAFFFIGRRLGMPVSLEGALKLKEISYVHAEGFAGGELKHGTLALVTEDTPVLATLTDGANPQETLNNVKEVQSRGAPVVGISSIDAAESYLDVGFAVPELGELEPLVANVYLQLFAYHVADTLGRDIDKPRNLAKSVTVE